LRPQLGEQRDEGETRCQRSRELSAIIEVSAAGTVSGRIG
jgi:hypothetical protein